MRARLILRYILGEMIPTFFMGVIVFILILLTFQALRLTDYILIHGVKVTVVLEMMGFLSTSFLPILFPMSLLFAVVLTYGRLSSDSEIVALRAIGLGMPSIIAPAVILSILIGILSLQTSFHIAPWGNRQFELLMTKLGSEKPATIVKEATFSEGFFDRVVYANKVNSKTGALEHVFVYDESNPATPLTVIAREGRIIQEKTPDGNAASLRLSDGSIHRSAEGRHTKIDFSTYDVSLLDPTEQQFRSKTPPSLTIEELRARMKTPNLKREEQLSLETEFHKRLALGVACILFALVGVGLGTVTNRRNVKSGGMVVVVAMIVIYYILYVAAEGAARKGQIPPAIAMWLANGLFTIAAGVTLKRSWN